MKNSFIIFLAVIFAVNCQMITKTGDVLIKPAKPTVSNKLIDRCVRKFKKQFRTMQIQQVKMFN